MSPHLWGFKTLGGVPFGGPTNDDHSLGGGTLGSHHLGKLPYMHRYVGRARCIDLLYELT